MADPVGASEFDISSNELSQVRDYVVSKNTAVLTVMFTDIEGFTELTETRGEVYSQKVRERHDQILVDAIQRDGSGLVVKFIGDAVMAVFSEPSVAVERAVLIQDRLDELNREDTGLEDIRVRIGLHMGQVAVEESVQTDVFGRHVNRAARIESLAAGRQIFISHAVFDSARGWLQGRNDLKFHLHGDYAVKGIDEPVAIYEVCRPETVPTPPAKGERVDAPKRTRLWPALALVAAGALGAIGYNAFQSTEVWLLRSYPEELMVDGEPALLEGDAKDEQRRISNALSVGRHVLHYDVHRSVRYYAPINVERGNNALKPRFEESRLPLISHAHGIAPDTPEDKRRFSHRKPYFVYDADGERHERSVTLDVEVNSKTLASGLIQHTYAWKLSEDGEVRAEGSVDAESDPASSDTRRGKTIEIYTNEPVTYYHRYRTRKQYIYVEVGAVFSEYM